MLNSLNGGSIMPEGDSTTENTNVLVIGAVQCPLRGNDEDSLDVTLRAIEMMKQASTETKVDLFVLPELAPIGYSEDTFQRFLPTTLENIKLHDKIHNTMVQAAIELESCICYGTIGVVDKDKKSPLPRTEPHRHNDLTIRQVVVDSKGTTIATYDKMLLCDYGDCAETRFFTAGQELCSFSIHSFQVGILICADMRNPMCARELTCKHKVDVILQPAAFSRDFSFRTWASFRETRAVENSIYWVAANYSGESHGESSFVEPWVDQDHEPDVMGCESDVLIGRVERTTLNHVRTTMPYYKLVTTME